MIDDGWNHHPDIRLILASTRFSSNRRESRYDSALRTEPKSSSVWSPSTTRFEWRLVVVKKAARLRLPASLSKTVFCVIGGPI